MQPIIIQNGQVEIDTATSIIWLTRYEIADLFGVFVSTVSNNIRSILTNRILCASKVSRMDRTSNGYVERYNLEMIVTLAFRFKSENAAIFRRWLIEHVTTPVIVWHIPNAENDKVN